MNPAFVYVAIPVALVMVFWPVRLVLRLLLSALPTSAGFATAQLCNFLMGLGWGGMLFASAHYLFGLPMPDQTGSRVAQIVGVALLLVPAMVLTLHEDGHVSERGYRRFVVVSLVFMTIGFTVGQAYVESGKQPDVGVHVSSTWAGAQSLARAIDSDRRSSEPSDTKQPMTDHAHEEAL